MPAPTRLRPARPARLGVALVALVAAGLGTTGATPVARSSVSTAAVATTATPCASSTGADERVIPGSGFAAVDPNNLTVAQTRQREAMLDSRLAAGRRNRAAAADEPATRRIDVYVNVMERNSGSGGVSTSRIKKQISVLNAAYSGKTSTQSVDTGFTFKLKKIKRVKKTSWYHWSHPYYDDRDDVAAKTKLHQGGYDDLNLYVTSLPDGLLGYATFPNGPLVQDGVVLLNTSLPGGSLKGYNTGDTATHEVGHWLGLLHTFENGCTAPGDEVADTPAQSDEGDAMYYCRDVDTCADDPGDDPVFNFMSYGNDACLNRFTEGQAVKMRENWDTYRDPKAST